MKATSNKLSSIRLLKQALLLVVALLSVSTAWGKTYTVTEAGTLQTVIGQDADTLTQIKVVGSIDSTDLAFLKTLATDKSLKDIDIHDTDVVSLPEKCFASTKVENVVLPKNLSDAGFATFQDCEQLRSIRLPNGLEEIPGNFANQCTQLESINMPDNLKVIGHYAFMECKGLKQATITLPKSVNDIYPGTFAYSDGIEEIVLFSDDLRSIPEIFACQLKTLKRITLPNCIESIGQYALASTSISEIKLPDNLKEIYPEGMAGMPNLKKIVLPEKFTTLYARAFKNSLLRVAYLNANLQNIGSRAFIENDSLIAVYCQAKVPPQLMPDEGAWWDSVPVPPFDQSQYERATLYIPQGTLQAYKQAEHWAKFKTIVEVAPGDWPPEASVNDVNMDHGPVVDRQYISVEGQVSTKPFTGVNIVRSTYADGHVTTTKVIK